MAHPLGSTDISIFSPEIIKFCYIKKCRYRLHFYIWFLIILILLESLKIFFFTNVVIIFMMSTKMATTDLFKTVSILKERQAMMSWSLYMTSPAKFYNVIKIILLHMRSCDQRLITLAFLWEKLSSPQFYKDLTNKTPFFEGWSWFKFNNLDLALGTFFLHECGKKVKIKSQVKLIETNDFTM